MFRRKRTITVYLTDAQILPICAACRRGEGLRELSRSRKFSNAAKKVKPAPAGFTFVNSNSYVIQQKSDVISAAYQKVIELFEKVKKKTKPFLRFVFTYPRYNCIPHFQK